MTDICCDSCNRTAVYSLILQDLVRERSGEMELPKFFCLMHTQHRVNACIPVVGRYSISIDPVVKTNG